MLEQLANAEKVRIGGMVQLTVRVKPAQKKRQGRNPATGEEITIAAKPASVDLRARPLAKAKTALPSVQKARRRHAASPGFPSGTSRRPSGRIGCRDVENARRPPARVAGVNFRVEVPRPRRGARNCQARRQQARRLA